MPVLSNAAVQVPAKQLDRVSCFLVPLVSVSGTEAHEFVQRLFEPVDNNSVS